MKTLFPFPIYRNLKRGNAINVQGRVRASTLEEYRKFIHLAPELHSTERSNLRNRSSFSSNFFINSSSDPQLLFVIYPIIIIVSLRIKTSSSIGKNGERTSHSLRFYSRDKKEGKDTVAERVWKKKEYGGKRNRQSLRCVHRNFRSSRANRRADKRWKTKTRSLLDVVASATPRHATPRHAGTVAIL